MIYAVTFEGTGEIHMTMDGIIKEGSKAMADEKVQTRDEMVAWLKEAIESYSRELEKQGGTDVPADVADVTDPAYASVQGIRIEFPALPTGPDQKSSERRVFVLKFTQWVEK